MLDFVEVDWSPRLAPLMNRTRTSEPGRPPALRELDAAWHLSPRQPGQSCGDKPKSWQGVIMTICASEQAIIFGLMVLAALLGSDVEVKRGIYSNLMDAFKIEDLIGIKSRGEFVESLAEISKQSKQFFILSNKYFDTVRARGRGQPSGVVNTPANYILTIPGEIVLTDDGWRAGGRKHS